MDMTNNQLQKVRSLYRTAESMKVTRKYVQVITARDELESATAEFWQAAGPIPLRLMTDATSESLELELETSVFTLF